VNLSSFGRRWITLPNATVANTALFGVIPTMAGGGIQFPATQVPSADPNTLDDYEEGTWTPAFSASGATLVHSAQIGTYTKIGRMVHVDMVIQLAAAGNTLSANVLSITGLPFSSAIDGPAPMKWFGTTGTFVLILGRFSGTTILVEGLAVAATASLGVNACNQLLHATNQTTFRLIGSYYV